MTGNLQADGVQSRQTLFVRYCPGITPQSACVVLPLLYRFSVKSARWLCKICVKNKLHFVEAGEGSLTSWKMFWAIQQKILPVCRFLVKLHRSAFPYAKIPAKFLCNLLKNLIIYLLYKLSVALPLIFLQNRGILFLKQYRL